MRDYLFSFENPSLAQVMSGVLIGKKIKDVMKSVRFIDSMKKRAVF